MRFQQIGLKNWRVYYGNVTMKFTPTGAGNLWVIDGNNGYGKTSLLKAIQWVLYEQELRPQLLSYLNRKALREGAAELSVQLLFEHENRQYNLLRRASLPDPSNQDPNSLRIDRQLFEDGRLVDDVQTRIDQMLPVDASQFFFFDGLEISRYAQVSHTDDTREAIEKILGIPAVRNARADVGHAITRWEKDLEEELKRDEEANQVLEEIEYAEGIAKKAQEKRKQLHQEVENAERLLSKVEEDIAQARGVEHLFKDKELYRERLQGFLTQLETLKAEEDRFLKSVPLLILEEHLTKIHTSWQLRMEGIRGREYQEAILRAKVEELEQLLFQHECLCGQTLEQGSSPFQRVTQRLTFLKAAARRLDEVAASVAEKGGAEPLLYEKLDVLLAGLRQIPRDSSILFARRARLEEDKAEVEQVLQRLEADIGGYDSAEMQALQDRKTDIKADLRNLRSRLDAAAEEIDGQEREQAALRRRLEKLGQATPRRIALEGNLRLAKAVLRALDGYVDDLVKAHRHRIEEETTKVHRLVTNKPGTYERVVLRSDYSLDLMDKEGNSIPTEGISAGEREALAFSFIAGLNLASGASAPIVMDTPFGHLDSEHRTNILRALPQLPTQVILLATDRDLPPSELPEYLPHLAGQFVICYTDGEQASRIEHAALN